MIFSINYLMYLLAGAALTGGPDGMFPKAGEVYD